VALTDVGYWLKACLQVGVLLIGAWFIYRQFIRHSYVEHLVRGLFLILMVFVGFWAVAKALFLPLWEGFFGLAIELLMFGLIVVFQPEIRRIFLYVGQVERSGKPFQQTLGNKATLVHEVVEAVKFLRKSRQGALMVLEPANALSGSYLEAGTPVDAIITTELLLTIFHPKTPLHDGAAVISHTGRLLAAGVLLPLTEDPKLSWQFGTRHRAAIGLSEVTDCHCLVVSEETGNISLAYQGQLQRVPTLEDLTKALEKVFGVVMPDKDKPNKMGGGKMGDLLRNEPGLKQVIAQIKNKLPTE
jgi:diadenylate cyclase